MIMIILGKEAILNEAARIKPGTITRVGYRTFLPVKASYKKQGVEVMKVVETSVRLGVSYSKIASVMARRAEEGMKEAIQRTNNYEWILDNKVCFNTKTNKYYLYAASLNGGHNTHSYYVIKHPEGAIQKMSSEEFKKSLYAEEYIIASYFKGEKNVPEIRNISFENVFRLGNVIA